MTAPAALDLLDPRLRTLCSAVLGAAQVPGASVAVVAADRAYHHAHGVKSVDHPEPVTLDTGFNIGSCSKAFAATALAALAARGACSWDDPVVRWVPEFQTGDPQLTAALTLRDLSANRSGLLGAGLTDSGLDPQRDALDLFSRLKHTAPAFALRSRFGYFNAGHSAVALAAGRIGGAGFLQTLRQEVLTPLAMQGTSGGAAAPAELANRAGWHVQHEGRIVAIDAVATDQYLGAGGMVVSGRDALQWLRLHLNGGRVDGVQIVPREALLETHRPHALARPGLDTASLFHPGAHLAAYALGWAVSDLEGHPLVMHSGSDLGVQAHTLLLPRAGIGIAVYGNSGGPQRAAVVLAHAIAGTLLGLAPRDWLAAFAASPTAAAREPSPAHVNAHALGVYTGRYAHPADGPLDITLNERGQLEGTLRDGYRMRFALHPHGANCFAIHFQAPEWRSVSADGALEITFTVDQGRSTMAHIGGPFSGRPFPCCEAAA